MSDKSRNVSIVQRELPIEWQFPEGLETTYANQMYVASGQSEVMLCFFETLPMAPIRGSQQEVHRTIQKIKTVPARCVSRIAMTKERYATFVKALTEHLERITKEEAEMTDDKPIANESE